MYLVGKKKNTHSLYMRDEQAGYIFLKKSFCDNSSDCLKINYDFDQKICDGQKDEKVEHSSGKIILCSLFAKIEHFFCFLQVIFQVETWKVKKVQLWKLIIFGWPL